MSGRSRVLIADDNLEFCELFSKYVAETDGLQFIGAVHNGEVAVASVRSLQPDILVLEIVMPKLDGLGVLETLKNDIYKPRIVIVSAFGQENLVSRALDLGANYYILKPFDLLTLMNRLQQIARPRYNTQTPLVKHRHQYLQQAVARYIDKLGVPIHYKGYNYLQEAIALVIEDDTLLTRMTRGLYPAVAKRYGTSPQLVERSIRHALEVTWTKGNLKLIDKLFAYSVDVDKGKPTNSAFIARIADQIRMQTRTG